MFRFTIRELVLLTLVAAMGVGWWLDHARAEKASAAMERRMDRQAAQISALRVDNEVLGRMHTPESMRLPIDDP
jgi:hypothetical protein